MASTALHIYAARYQTSEARNRVVQALQASAPPEWQGSIAPDKLPSVQELLQPPSGAAPGHSAPATPVPGGQRTLMHAIHGSVVDLLRSEAFVNEHGIYPADASLLEEWAAEAAPYQRAPAPAAVPGPDPLRHQLAAMQQGVDVYCKRLRHRAARQAVLAAFQQVLAEHGHAEAAAQLALPTVLAWDSMRQPLAVTDSVRAVWPHAQAAMARRQPFLLTGSSGCGKSGVLRAVVAAHGLPWAGLELLPGGNYSATVLGFGVRKPPCPACSTACSTPLPCSKRSFVIQAHVPGHHFQRCKFWDHCGA